MYYDLGFIYYTELKDYKKAAEVFAQGSKVPNAHPFLKILAAVMAEHADDYQTARLLVERRVSVEQPGETIRQNALEHLRAIQVDEDVTNLQNAVTAFRSTKWADSCELVGELPPRAFAGHSGGSRRSSLQLSLDGQVLKLRTRRIPIHHEGTASGI